MALTFNNGDQAMSFTSSGPRSGVSSAKSVTSVSGTSPGIASASSTSGSSVSGSSLLSDLKSAGDIVANGLAAQGLPLYAENIRRMGDVFFHVDGGTVGHTNMVAQDVTQKIDSVDPDGVRRIPMDRDHHPALVFRFSDQSVAQRAALVAGDWVNNVNYSDASMGIGITFRALGAVFGSCKFGLGAQARLLKYRSRANLAPKNVICSEMCVLAYQLSMQENDACFIRLDAKHTLPSDLMKYFVGEGRAYWQLVAYR